MVSKDAALRWAAESAVSDDLSEYESAEEWLDAHGDRFRGIGATQIRAVIDALRNEHMELDLRKYLMESGQVLWVDVLGDIEHGCMSEFITTPHGVLLMDCG